MQQIQALTIQISIQSLISDEKELQIISSGELEMVVFTTHQLDDMISCEKHHVL
jgi:hypothetical protein